MSTHRSGFQTVATGLDQQSFPMNLYAKALRHGVWNPQAIDLTVDRQHWLQLDDQERDLFLRLVAMFQGGEEAVTLDLLPLIGAVARQGQLEEELFLTTFLADEAKHTVFFRRVLDEVAQVSRDLSGYATPSYVSVFHEALPAALSTLAEDDSPAALLRAAVTYNMVVEGVLAETGYHAFFEMLQRRDLMPGVREGIGWLKRDESRHIAYGIYLIGRLLDQDAGLWPEVEGTLGGLALPAMGVVQEALAEYSPVPFGLSQEQFLGYAMGQLQRRTERLRGIREQGIEGARQSAAAELDD